MEEKNRENLEESIEETGEDNVDEADLEVVEEINQSKIKDLKDKLKACQAEKITHLEDLQRAKAEFLNAKKRLEDEKSSSVERTINSCVEKLLPLCDSFSMAMSNQEAWQAIDEGWRKGVESINNQLQSILKNYGVEQTGTTNEEFDPEKHEALGSTEVEDENMVDKVIEMIQTGYVRKVNDKEVIIRPARVIVGTLKK